MVLLWIAAISLALALYFWQVYSKFTKHGVKHLSVIPPFGNITGIIFGVEHLSDSFIKLYNAFPEEKFVGRYAITSPVIVPRDLELIKKIAIKDFDHFTDRLNFQGLKKIDPLFTRSLPGLSGQDWKDMRSTLSPAFTSSKIKLMVPFMEEVGEQMIKSLKRKISECKDKTIEINIKDLTTRYATDVIASCAYGLKIDSHSDPNNEFYQMGKEVATLNFRHLMVIIIYSVLPTFAKAFDITFLSTKAAPYFYKIFTTTMKERETHNIVRPDMIHLLKEAKKGQLKYENTEVSTQDAGFATVEESDIGKKHVEKAWSDTELVAQAVVFFLAGFDTVSTIMSLALHELALNPDIQERLAREIIENESQNGSKLDYNIIQKLEYLDMVVSETLRRWPPLTSLDRICVKDYNIGKPNEKAKDEYIIRKGDIVNIPVWPVHYDPEYYPNPEKFNPERFSKENRHKINPTAYMPFGIGPRNCIGSRFALCEVKILLYQILLHIEVGVSNKTCVPSQIRPEIFSPSLKGGHWLQFKLRSRVDK